MRVHGGCRDARVQPIPGKTVLQGEPPNICECWDGGRITSEAERLRTPKDQHATSQRIINGRVKSARRGRKPRWRHQLPSRVPTERQDPGVIRIAAATEHDHAITVGIIDGGCSLPRTGGQARGDELGPLWNRCAERQRPDIVEWRLALTAKNDYAISDRVVYGCVMVPLRWM